MRFSPIHTFFIVLLVAVADRVTAQQSISFNPIPLYKPIEVELLGGDEDVLQCYNLYGYNYIKGADTIYGEFIVPKEEDTFRQKTVVSLKLGRVREFAVRSALGCRKMTIDQGIQLKYTGQKEMVYLNFDPAMPDPVFIPCK